MNKPLVIFIAIAAAGYFMATKTKHLSANQIDGTCDVVLFTTPSCGYCKKALHYFAEHSVSVCDKDIQNSSSNHDLFKELGGRGVPLVIIGNESINGYNPTAYNQALQKLNNP